MVSKCANPDCTASFRYFHIGKLFRLDSPPAHTHKTASGEDEMLKRVPRLEFFWLCDECAGKMTLTFEKGMGVSVQPKHKYAAAVAA
jgi:hypothetical protein